MVYVCGGLKEKYRTFFQETDLGVSADCGLKVACGFLFDMAKIKQKIMNNLCRTSLECNFDEGRDKWNVNLKYVSRMI